MKGTLILFAKVPRPGRVKTRLARDIGPVAATWWYRHQLARLVRRVGCDRRWRTILAVSPDHEGLASPLLPPGPPRLPQGPGDLGARMARALNAEPGPVVVVGSDIPGVTPARIAGAFDVLRGHDAVLGPARDGGFWLIGIARGGRPLPPGLFGGVRWSSPAAMTETLATLCPLTVGFAATLHDVDTADDLVGEARGLPGLGPCMGTHRQHADERADRHQRRHPGPP